MAKKKNETNKNEKNDGGGDGGGNDGDGGKKYKVAGVTVVVLKMDLHCEGCAGRVVKAVRTLDGVESVRIGDSELNKLTVIGNVDPVKLRQKVEEKTKKKVEILSPTSKKPKDGDTTNERDGGGGGKKKEQKQPENENDKTTKKDEKKPKELPVTTAVLKVPLHCQGCIQKIHKLVSKTKGYMEMSLDKEKDLVIVKGAIDMKILAAALQSKLKRVVEIVPAKKDGGGDGEKKGKGGGGGGGNDGEGKGGGGGKGEKKGKGGSGGGGNDGGGGGNAGFFKMDTYGGGPPVVYPYPQYTYGSGYGDYVHAPQLFSDENPNACVLM
ncbi:heavy metal-associated isoprenylated plant protein 3-like protein [Tanacetum coccineum]